MDSRNLWKSDLTSPFFKKLPPDKLRVGTYVKVNIDCKQVCKAPTETSKEIFLEVLSIGTEGVILGGSEEQLSEGPVNVWSGHFKNKEVLCDQYLQGKKLRGRAFDFHELPSELTVLDLGIGEQVTCEVIRTPAGPQVKNFKNNKIKSIEQVNLNVAYIETSGNFVGMLLAIPPGSEITGNNLEDFPFAVNQRSFIRSRFPNHKFVQVKLSDLVDTRNILNSPIKTPKYTKDPKPMNTPAIDFKEMMKADLEAGMYRAAGDQTVEIMRKAISRLLAEKSGNNENLKVIEEVLGSKAGEAVVAMASGLMLTYAPVVGQDPRAVRLAEQLRQKGFAEGMNMMFMLMMEVIGPALKEVVNTLPAEKARIATDDKTVEPAAETEAVASEEVSIKTNRTVAA